MEDFRSTDLAGAAYLAGIFGQCGDSADGQPSRLEAELEDAECELGLFVPSVSWEGTDGLLLSGKRSSQ